MVRKLLPVNYYSECLKHEDHLLFSDVTVNGLSSEPLGLYPFAFELLRSPHKLFYVIYSQALRQVNVARRW